MEKLPLSGLGKDIGALLGKEGVIAAYLFGSAASGKQGPLSDIDIGVYMEPGLPPAKKAKLKLKLLSNLQALLNTNKIDLVIMNDSIPGLNYEIIKQNKRLFSKGNSRIFFEAEILSKYLDRRYYEQRHLDLFMQKLLKGGFS